MKAIGTIITADLVMSLDNVVAVAGAAGGHIMMIAMGVAISIPIMIFGSKLILKAMEKFSWISYVGSGILAWTAGEMILKDKQFIEILNIKSLIITYLIISALTALILGLGYVTNKRIALRKEISEA
jgi:predicted tellurium resistance membrane protein TerC